MGNSPKDCGPAGQWLGFIFIWWGIVLMGSCPRTMFQRSVGSCKNYYIVNSASKNLFLSATVMIQVTDPTYMNKIVMFITISVLIHHFIIFFDLFT